MASDDVARVDGLAGPPGAASSGGAADARHEPDVRARSLHAGSADASDLQDVIAAALGRLRALGNPRCTLIDQGRWRRDHPGWTLDVTLHDQPDSPVSLLASGRLLLGTRRLSTARLHPNDCARLSQAVQRLGSGVLRPSRARSTPPS